MSSRGRATVHSVHDMDIDEVSLVDRPANQHATMLIAKSYQGADVSEPITEIEAFLSDGTPVTDESELVEGQEVFDADGQRYVWTAEDDDAAAEAAQADLTMAKNAGNAFQPGRGRETLGKSLATVFQEELSKAQTGADVSAVISKMAVELSKADERATEAEGIAKSERDLRLEREYIGKAAEYNVPIDPVELGPVLKRMAECMAYEDCVVIDKALNASGQMLFTELGFQGGGTPAGEDPMADAAAYAAGEMAKNAAGGNTPTQPELVEKYYIEHPEAYTQYLQTRG